MKRTFSFLLLLCATVLAASCSPVESPAPSATQSAPAIAQTPAALAEGLTAYSNEDFGFSIGILPILTNSRDLTDEKNLRLVAADEDFINNLFVIIKENTDGITLSEYRRSSPLWAYLQGESVANEDIQLNGIDFWKIVGHDTSSDMEMVKIIFVAIEKSFTYEITLTLTEDVYNENTALLEGFEKSILITPLG